MQKAQNIGAKTLIFCAKNYEVLYDTGYDSDILSFLKISKIMFYDKIKSN